MKRFVKMMTLSMNWILNKRDEVNMWIEKMFHVKHYQPGRRKYRFSGLILRCDEIDSAVHKMNRSQCKRVNHDFQSKIYDQPCKINGFKFEIMIKIYII